MMASIQRLICAAIVAAGLLSTFAACEPEELDVAYLYIDRPSVAPGGRAEPGAIVAVRVVVGTQSLGFYPLPARVPILGTGVRTIRIEPAVRRSGLSQDIRVYPLYEPVVRELTLALNQTDTLRPVFTYASTATVGLEEGFETATSAFVLDLAANGSAPLQQDPDDPRVGSASGVITLTRERPVYEVASLLVEPDRARVLDLWLELDYRGDVPLNVSLFPENVVALPPGTPLVARYFQGARPRADWTRLYFDIVDESNDAFVNVGFRVSLLALYDEALGGTQTVHLDNVKVVYR